MIAPVERILAQALGVPGAHTLLLVSLVAALVATLLTARDPRGDYARAWRAFSDPNPVLRS